MHATTVAVDIAKDVFELSFADASGKVIGRRRLRRPAFSAFFDNHPPAQVIMEACGSAHYWARRFEARGFSVRLLPAQYVRPYVLGNKTDRNDTDGILRADQVAGMAPVPVKTVDQQGIQSLHRLREHHKAQRTASINALRGLLREFGIVIPLGADKVRPAVLAALEDGDNELPMALRHALGELLDHVSRQGEAMRRIEHALEEFAQRDIRSQRYRQATGIGLINATALSACFGDLDRFKSGRHFASALGLTPRESSSGNSRKLGRLSKRGDPYLRTTLIHGARALLLTAAQREKKLLPLDPLSAWALALSRRIGHNKAACAVANKLARRLWAAEHHRTSFDPHHRSVQPTLH